MELLSEIEQLIKDTEELRSEKGMACFCINQDLMFCYECMFVTQGPAYGIGVHLAVWHPLMAVGIHL